MNSTSKKIAFLRTEPWPHANVRIVQALQDEFPDCNISIINVYEKIKSNPQIVARNLLEVWKIYGREILTRKKRFKRCFWRTPFIFHQMRRLIQEALLADTYLFSFQIQSLFNASLEGIPHFVYTDHTHLANLTYPGFKYSDLYNQHWIDLEKTIYSNASLNFVRSSNIAKSLIDDYQRPPAQVVCAYAGSNAVEQVLEVNLNKYDNKHILFVGIDWERKGGWDLLAAFELVRRVYPETRMTIVGCSPVIYAPNCRVVGRVPVHEVGKYFQEASIFCLPTTREPFGIVFVEAMATRTPIVATHIGAIPDFVHHGLNGYLVKPGDVPGMAEALIDLISDPHKSRLFGERGFELAQDRYSWNAVGRLLKKHIVEHLPSVPI